MRRACPSSVHTVVANFHVMSVQSAASFANASFLMACAAAARIRRSSTLGVEAIACSNHACRARRSSANAARLEACCGDNSARGGVTDGHRPASERRLLTLFDRRVERVHIDVNDPSDLRLVHNGEASRFGTLRERRNRGSVARSLSSGTGGLMARTRERDQIVARMVTSRSRAVPPAWTRRRPRLEAVVRAEREPAGG